MVELSNVTGGQETATRRCAEVASAGSRLAPPGEQEWELGGVWGLGTTRSLGKLEEFMEVDFTSRSIQPRALTGGLNYDAFVK